MRTRRGRRTSTWLNNKIKGLLCISKSIKRHWLNLKSYLYCLTSLKQPCDSSSILFPDAKRHRVRCPITALLFGIKQISHENVVRSVLSCLLSCPEMLTPFDCFSAFNAGDPIKQITFSFLCYNEFNMVPVSPCSSNCDSAMMKEYNDSECVVSCRDFTLLLENLLFSRFTGFFWNVTSASAAGRFQKKFTRDEGHTHDTEVYLCSPRGEKRILFCGCGCTLVALSGFQAPGQHM